MINGVTLLCIFKLASKEQSTTPCEHFSAGVECRQWKSSPKTWRIKSKNAKGMKETSSYMACRNNILLN